MDIGAVGIGRLRFEQADGEIDGFFVGLAGHREVEVTSLGYNEPMARELNSAALFLKWLVIPVALGAVGFYIVGPRFGGQVQHSLDETLKSSAEPAESHAAPKDAVDDSSSPRDDSTDSKSSPREVATTEGGPEIEVTARPVRRIRPQRRRRPKPKPKVQVVDEGSDAAVAPPAPDATPAPTAGDSGDGGGNGNHPSNAE